MILDDTWMGDAACRARTNEMFPEDELRRPGLSTLTDDRRYMAAKAICASCPVLEECREWVMATELDYRRYGVAGGMSPGERSRESVRRARTVAA